MPDWRSNMSGNELLAVEPAFESEVFEASYVRSSAK
jgi:hypothetical protein